MARRGLYQPFVEDRNVRRLYRLKVAYRERTGQTLPMTALVNRILDDFFALAAHDLATDLAAAAARPLDATPDVREAP